MATIDNTYDPDDILKEHEAHSEEPSGSEDEIDDGRESFEEELRQSAEDFE
jgi:hypothetical protein